LGEASNFSLFMNFDLAPKVGFNHINKLIPNRIAAIIDMLITNVIFINLDVYLKLYFQR
jgi:hypothetical protein